MSFIDRPCLVWIKRGSEIYGLWYQVIEVANIIIENETAVNSSVVIGNPELFRWISLTVNQNVWKIVMILNPPSFD